MDTRLRGYDEERVCEGAMRGYDECVNGGRCAGMTMNEGVRSVKD